MSARVFSSSSMGNNGQVMPNGDIVDRTGFRRGRISPQGELRDQHGRLIGRISQNGQFKNVVGRSARLTLSPSGDIQVSNEKVGRVQVAWGMRLPDMCVGYAAAYLLNQPVWVWK